LGKTLQLLTLNKLSKNQPIALNIIDKQKENVIPNFRTITKKACLRTNV